VADEPTEEERRMNAFTAEDRRLLEQTYNQVIIINGTVKRHDEEIFGHDGNHTVGLVETRDQFLEFKTQIKTGIAVLIAIGTLLGASNIAILIRSAGL